jgi:hypothetical protein
MLLNQPIPTDGHIYNARINQLFSKAYIHSGHMTYLVVSPLQGEALNNAIYNVIHNVVI